MQFVCLHDSDNVRELPPFLGGFSLTEFVSYFDFIGLTVTVPGENGYKGIGYKEILKFYTPIPLYSYEGTFDNIL